MAAEMCGQDKKITTMIGWDPRRRVSVGFRSTLPLLGGNTKLPPVKGQWRLACGLDKDPTVVYFGCQVSHQQKKRFETFLRSLSGRPDLGEHLSNGVLHFPALRCVSARRNNASTTMTRTPPIERPSAAVTLPAAGAGCSRAATLSSTSAAGQQGAAPHELTPVANARGAGTHAGTAATTV